MTILIQKNPDQSILNKVNLNVEYCFERGVHRKFKVCGKRVEPARLEKASVEIYNVKKTMITKNAEVQ